MPLQKVQFRPGISRESTNYANEGGWYECDKVRFRSGSPEKLGGWAWQGDQQYVGLCRHLNEWTSLSGFYLLGVGTHTNFYIWVSENFYDILPLPPNTPPPGLPINEYANGWGVGRWGVGHGWGTPAPSYSPAVLVTRLRTWSGDNFGEDLVYNYNDGPIYYWDASTNLNSSGVVTGPGANLKYLSGADLCAPSQAAWAFVTEERHIVALGANVTIPVLAETIAVGINYTIAEVGNTNFIPLGAASNTIGVSFNAILPGSTVAGTTGTVVSTYSVPSVQQPMMVSWCSQENPLIWNPDDITNTAGNQLLAIGSRLITAEKTRQEYLIWSDAALYSMRYLGAPYIFGFNVISASVSIASPNAKASAAGMTFWMGVNKFYMYSGRVESLPCSLYQYVFDDINKDQLDMVYAGTSERYNEVWWHYPSAGSLVNNRYIVFNYLEKVWYYGSWDAAQQRTAWMNSTLFKYPVAGAGTTANGKILFHEIGANDGFDVVEVPINAYVRSSDFDFDAGDQFAFIKRVIHDIDFIGSSTDTPVVDVTLAVRNYPGQALFTQSTDSVVNGVEVTIQVYSFTTDTWVRLRGRQAAFSIESNSLDVRWQLGVPRLELQADGRR